MPRKKRALPAPAPEVVETAAPAGSMPVSAIDLHHEEYDAVRKFWEVIGLLYRSGYELQQQSSKVLRTRPVEPPAVYTARQKEFTAQDILKSGIGWYQSSLYTDQPTFKLLDGPDGKPVDEAFLGDFFTNADRCGKSLIEVSKQWLVRAMRDRWVYVLKDLPQSSLAANFREQKQRGDLNAYLVTFSADQVINWSMDRFGEFDWIVIATQRVERNFGQKPLIVDQWYYFDRQEYRLYESPRAEENPNVGEQDRMARVVAQGRHALADQNRVPVQRIEVPEHLWMGDRVYLQILDHLNQENAFTWSLKQSCLAVPVIIGKYSAPVTLSETAYIHLPESGSKFEWSEAPGRSFQAAADRVNSLREEIYRTMHLQAQGRSSAATPSAQSGYSKEQDMAPARDIAAEMGSLMREVLKQVVEDVALIAGKAVSAEVTGLEPEDEGVIIDIAEVEAGLDLQIPSETCEKYLFEKAAMRITRRAPSEVRDKIRKEITAAPTRAEAQAQQQKQLGAQFSGALESALAKTAIKENV